MKKIMQKLISLFTASSDNKSDDKNTMAQKLIQAYGGEENITSLNACITRLRIEVIDTKKVDQKKLKELGAAGVITKGKNMQAIYGSRSEDLMQEMKKYISAETETQKISSEEHTDNKSETYIGTEESEKILKWIESMGGKDNILKIEACALTRLRIELRNKEAVKLQKLENEGVGGVALLDKDIVHLLVGFDAKLYAGEMERYIK